MVMIEFINGEDMFTYSFQELDQKSMGRTIEKIENEISVISLEGVEYHLVENRKWVNIIWQKDNLLYTLAGSIDEAEAINVIKSIQYKEE